MPDDHSASGEPPHPDKDTADPASARAWSSTHKAGSDVPPSIPKKIGRYSIKRVLASGGMGVVYLAQQEQPRRTVALKVMKAGVTSRSAPRRFERGTTLTADR